MPVNDARYAVYLTPAEPWNALGSRWLGRDALTGERIERSAELDDARVDAWTSGPRTYGLHATLKPPFRLAAGRSAAELDVAVRALAARMRPFALSLEWRPLRGFLAWRPADESVERGPLQALADACVRELDGFRAPQPATDVERRRAAGLTPREEAHLVRWGYPYVFDTFAFHITLTNQLDTASADAATNAFARLAARHGCAAALDAVSMNVRDVSIFVQPAPDRPFVVARHYGFDGSTRDGAGAAALKDHR
ncbi:MULTISPECIES: DUF1045 domain-containing protein [Burkholderia]|uniref:Phosphonate metabolism protein n=1 Tax=Burkholderia savannae TaxID=1637837 RepID=A0ABR5T281_9BURK|nr:MULTISPECIES: DUF1045 domain-containing protein [Burkholderia]KGS04145.1 2'-5' RNA ligase superfamily protein [Burkholderia sp. ABCPW 111]KVK73611.1 hypothetical protein WS91_19910 [Burkholderia sp. MSMB1498]KWZ37342.1 hypothetical protein WS72_20340 [Burkholderia savannae]